jgi:molybdopterin molybdotransferase
MTSLEQALNQILSAVQPIGDEVVGARAVFGRILARDVFAPIDLPSFDNSAMDGYAVRASDLRSASQEFPVSLRQIGKIAAGEQLAGEVGSGQCARIFTGSPLPRGADAVIMQEDVTASGDCARFFEPARPFENIRLQGEDIKKGAPIARQGERVSATRAGVFAACGIGEIVAARRPVVALLATGSELREPGESLRPGQIHESNRALLAPLLADGGCEARWLPLIEDGLEKTEQAIEKAFESADVIITTGGVSVGEFDFVKEAFSKIGGTIEVWRVAVRPGKPFVFGRRGPKYLFGLPGNPVSALVTFLLLARPALLKMQQSRCLNLPEVDGKLADAVHNKGERRHFMRVTWENGRVSVRGPQASHMLGSIAGANGLMEVAPGERKETGAVATVRLWELPAV